LGLCTHSPLGLQDSSLRPPPGFGAPILPFWFPLRRGAFSGFLLLLYGRSFTMLKNFLVLHPSAAPWCSGLRPAFFRFYGLSNAFSPFLLLLGQALPRCSPPSHTSPSASLSVSGVPGRSASFGPFVFSSCQVDFLHLIRSRSSIVFCSLSVHYRPLGALLCSLRTFPPTAFVCFLVLYCARFFLCLFLFLCVQEPSSCCSPP